MLKVAIKCTIASCMLEGALKYITTLCVLGVAVKCLAVSRLLDYCIAMAKVHVVD